MGIRLTTKIDKISMKKYYLNIIKDKDQRIAELEQDLEFTTKTANDLIEIKHKLEQDRDTWKRACDLACEKLSLYSNGYYADYFYRIAKTKEMMSKEELIEEIKGIRQKLYDLQAQKFNVKEETSHYINEYLDKALYELKELKEFLIELLGG